MLAGKRRETVMSRSPASNRGENLMHTTAREARRPLQPNTGVIDLPGGSREREKERLMGNGL